MASMLMIIISNTRFISEEIALTLMSAGGLGSQTGARLPDSCLRFGKGTDKAPKWSIRSAQSACTMGTVIRLVLCRAPAAGCWLRQKTRFTRYRRQKVRSTSRTPPRPHQWHPPLKAPGFRYRLPYNCRHTYATMYLMSGMNPAFISQQLHPGVQMLLSTYACWINSSSDWSKLEMLNIGINPIQQATSH